MSFNPKIAPLGDSALLVHLGDDIDLVTNRRVHALAALIQAAALEGIIETVPGYGTLLIHYDPLILNYADIHEWVRGRFGQLHDALERKPRLLEIPTHYGGEYGIDLEFVAEYHHLRVADVIRIHSGRTYTVYMMGFTPGFPYMGKLDETIVTPRLETPRTQVSAGTVAIAGSQTGIYPISSPGGWRLIGHTALQLFNPASEAPFLFSPGDEVRFLVAH